MQASLSIDKNIVHEVDSRTGRTTLAQALENKTQLHIASAILAINENNSSARIGPVLAAELDNPCGGWEGMG